VELGKYKQALAYMKRQAFQNGGEAIVPKPKPLTESQIKNKLDLYIKGFIGGFDKMEMVDLMNDLSKKADESGVMSQEDVFEFVKERKDFYQKFLEENQGEAIELPRQKFADGLTAIEFGKLQSATTPENLRRQLSPSQKDEIVPKIVRQALKEAGIEYTPKEGPGKRSVFNNVTKETIKKFNEAVRRLKKEQGIQMTLADANVLKKRVKDFVLDKLKKGEYVSRPIIKKELNLPEGKGTADSIITKALGVKQGSGQGAPYKGGLLDKLGKEERAEITRQLGKKLSKEKYKQSDEIIKALNEEFKFDPDVERGPELTRRIYGDTFDKADAAGKAELINQVDNDIRKYLRALEGGYKPKGMKLPDQETINDIIDRIDTGEFKFSSGVKRNLVFDSIDNLLGVPSGTFKTQRRNLTKKGFELDEIFGLSGVSRKAPGYAEAFQLISPEANQAKKNIIDLPLSKLLTAIDEGKESVVYKKKKMSLDEAIKNFNKDSLKFSNEYKIKSPKINKGVKFNKSDYKNFSKESIKNIEDVYKDKDYFLSEVKNKPVETFTEKAEKVSKRSPIEQIKDMELRLPSEAGMISTDLLKDVGKFGLKTIGSLPVAVGLAADTTKRGMDEGKSFIDAVTQPMVGVDLLFPEAFKKLGPLMAKAARVSTPIGAGITGIGLAKDFIQAGIKEKQYIDSLTPFQKQQYLEGEVAPLMDEGGMLADGGRVGYADGPDDPSKRKFLKIMGGLASLPLVGRFFRVGEMAAPVAEKAVETVSEAPKYFFDLVNKIKLLGTESKIKPGERMTETNYTGMDGSEYTLTEDSVTGLQRIEKDKIGGYADENVSFDTIENKSVMEYQPSRTTEDGIEPDYYDEGTATFDRDGTVDGFDDGMEDDIIEQIKKEVEPD
jgi:hypothetical protein